MPSPVSLNSKYITFLPRLSRNAKGVIFIGLSKNGKVMGRPTTDPKKHETRIRMTDEDVQLLEYCAKETGLTKTEIIRQGIREVYAKLKQ